MSKVQNKEIFETVLIGKLELKNRFAVAPMTRISATENGVPTDKMVSYYRSFAKGGFALVITEGTYIDDKYSQTYKFQPGIVFESHIEGWKKVSASIHQHGAKAIMQIQHAGALSQGNYYFNGSLAPSAVQPKGEQLDFYFGQGAYAVPTEITLEQISEVKQSFVKAAQNAQSAGFDGVEIHGANGYLLDQFLTNYTNQRNDLYGGSITNRVRLLAEIIAEVKASVHNDFLVGIRISQGKVNDYFHKWQDETEAEVIFSTLKDAGADYLHITEFNAAQPAFAPDKYKSDLHFSLAAIAKKATGLPVFANGQIDTKEIANTLLCRDNVDLVTIGKAALANHDFPEKISKNLSLLPFMAEATLRPTAELKDFELI